MEGIEILLHNLSHSDLIIGLKGATSNSITEVARPKFSYFRKISEDILKTLEKDENIVSITKLPLFSDKDKQYVKGEPVPVGYKFENSPVKIDDPSSLRFRNDSKLNQSDDCNIEFAYFPLISVLLPKWLKNIDESRKDIKKVVVLVSGRGTPSDESASIIDNSTKPTAKLIEHFIHRVYPDIVIQRVHSSTNLFRYDENIVFVKQELLPLINKHRDDLVAEVGAKWKECLQLTLSFADGSSARISAINASMRYYRPSYMHFWKLKTFWREMKICEDDIECHSFEEIATEPAIDSNDAASDPLVQAVVAEMTSFRQHFKTVLNNPNISNDLATFWLRKTKKPVLAVMLVQKPNQPYKLYRGTNMEVSMPTGSLCAERNMIGTALSDDITLQRQDIKLICVYAATIPTTTTAAASVCDSTNIHDARNLATATTNSVSCYGSEIDAINSTVNTNQQLQMKLYRSDSLTTVDSNNMATGYRNRSNSISNTSPLAAAVAADIHSRYNIRSCSNSLSSPVIATATTTLTIDTNTQCLSPAAIDNNNSSTATTPIGTPASSPALSRNSSSSNNNSFIDIDSFNSSRNGSISKSPTIAVGSKRKILSMHSSYATKKDSTTANAMQSEETSSTSSDSIDTNNNNTNTDNTTKYGKEGKKHANIKQERQQQLNGNSEENRTVLQEEKKEEGLKMTVPAYLPDSTNIVKSSVDTSSKAMKHHHQHHREEIDTPNSTSSSMRVTRQKGRNSSSNNTTTTTTTVSPPTTSAVATTSVSQQLRIDESNCHSNNNGSSGSNNKHKSRTVAFCSRPARATTTAARIGSSHNSTTTTNTSTSLEGKQVATKGSNNSSSPKSLYKNDSLNTAYSTSNYNSAYCHVTTTSTTITVDENDLNPLKPCGACNEWLKKIAEVNPQLRVITFTDASCKGIYIEQIDD